MTAIKESTTGILIAIGYGICSVSMAFINKALLTSFGYNHSIFIVLCQMVFGLILMEVLRLANLVSLANLSVGRCRLLFLPSVFYALHSVLSLSALNGLNIAMYTVIKRCAPAVILLLGAIVLKKERPSAGTIFSVMLITIGCITAGYGDLSFEWIVYSQGMGSVVSQAIYLLLVQKMAQTFSPLETLHINSANTAPLLFTSLVLSGDLLPALHAFDLTSPSFVILFCVTVMAGVLLNFTLFLCTMYNSALTTSITGTLKSVLQTIVGLFTFGGIDLNVWTVGGIVMNTAGGLVYSYDKYRHASHHPHHHHHNTESGPSLKTDPAHRGSNHTPRDAV